MWTARDVTRRDETRRDEAPNATVPRETIKGRHTMRMCVSRDKNLESRVTRNWRCELTADLALIASRSALRNRARVVRTYVRMYVHARLYIRHIDSSSIVCCRKIRLSYNISQIYKIQKKNSLLNILKIY